MRLAKPNGALFLYRLKRLFNLRAWNSKLLIARTGSILIAAVIAGLIVNFIDNGNNTDNKDISFAKQITALQKAGDCTKGLNAVKSLQTDPNDLDYSINLLSYRAQCQLQQGAYSSAVANLNELKTDQQKAKKYDDVSDTQEQIKSAQSAIRNQKNTTYVGQSGPAIDYRNQLWDQR